MNSDDALLPGSALRSTAVVYVTDAGYLIPSLVSAEQFHRQVGDFADVIIALVGLPDAKMTRIRPIIEDLGLRTLFMDEIVLPAGATLRIPYLSPATLGRLELPRYLPRHYTNIIYVDGDTQVVGDVRPLVRLDVPQGLIAAAPDSCWITAAGWFHGEAYLAGLGVSRRADYFNTGVFAMSRDTLDHVMPQALDFFLANSAACHYADQSALNAVMRGKVFWMSPRYNFIQEYDNWGVDKLFDPVIRHFAGHLKPWKLAGWRPGERFAPTYADLLVRYPDLQVYAAPVQAFVAAPPRPQRAGLRGIYDSRPFRPIRAARDAARFRRDLRTLPASFALA